MFNVVLFISIAVPLALLALDVRRRPPQQLVLSHFWYFTLIWGAAFPLRAWLITAGHTLPQVALQGVNTGWAPTYDNTWYAIALGVSCIFWLTVYIGYRTGNTVTLSSFEAPPVSSMIRPRIVIGLVFMIGIGATLYLNPDLNMLDSNIYQKARMGKGALWILPEIFIYGVIAYIALLISRQRHSIAPADILILLISLLTAFWLGSEIFSRRLAASVLLGLVILLVVRKRRLWSLGLITVLGTVFASGILELIRRMPRVIAQVTENQGSINSIFTAAKNILFRDHILFLSTSFEGAEHIAHFLSKATWPQILSGVDYGLSWIYNLGLGLLPRAIWTSKPLIYGGLEQLHWLYPTTFRGTFAASAPPTSFIVDFCFGFGIPIGLLMAFFLGRFFKTCERSIWLSSGAPALLALSLMSFIFMFNFVRGGTAMGQTLIIFSGVCLVMFGWNQTLKSIYVLVSGTFNIFPSSHAYTSSLIYFYPHTYLRDRQLDTIRGWPKDHAVNADIAEQRTGTQVERDQALAPARSSWKTILPLINLKRRPKDAPQDAAVYVWGGLIAKGPFITDIDNPYAFTGYNTLAVKLYRPIIQSFLESPRCLQIRCLSQACLDGVRREYGDVAAAKAIVAYPKITAKVTEPRTQSAGTCRFLFVSTQFEIKGGAALLNAFKRVVHEFPGAELDLVTHLPDGIDVNIPHVRVHPANLTREDIGERFLSNADVLIHPTYFESFGMVVLEALAHGLPVIATDVYAIKEMVEDQNNGLLLEAPLSIWSGTRPTPLFSDTTKVRDLVRMTDTSKFEDALTEAMLKMARDTKFRTQASAASLQLVRTKFSGTL